MPFSPVFNYSKTSGQRFPQHIMTADIVPALNETQEEWNAFIDIVKGVLPDTKLELDETPFTFRFLGNYAGEIDFNGHKIALQGTNPLAGWTGTEFIVPTGMGGFVGYPIGAVLPFFTEPPAGWQKLDGQFYYIETGETGLTIQASQNRRHKHPGSSVRPVRDGASWLQAQGSRLWAGNIRNKQSIQPAAPANTGIDTQHSHDGYTEEEGGSAETDEARPPHVKCIFARRIS